jgi:FAD/FMN-containing dehydrogenase
LAAAQKSWIIARVTVVDQQRFDAEVTRLGGLVEGWVSVPGEDRYTTARLTFNGLLDRRPVLAVSCRTVDDVRRAVESADRLGLPVSVRGGGHSVAGHGVGADSLLVDLSPMRDVAVDPVARRVRVAGGAVWNDVDAATQRHGLAVPGGTFGDTGVGGLTLGGGIGWLIGTGGLTCDNLVSAELVTPTGEVVVAGEGGDPELLWALRGGGGNFGVVTSFELTMHERGPMLGGLVLFRVDDAPAVLTGVAELMREAPDELVIQPAVRVGIDNAQSGCAVMFAYAGPPEDGRPYVDAIRQLAVPLSESHGPMSYLQVQAMNELLPFGLRHYWSGHFVSDIHPETASAVCERLDQTPGLNIILFEPLSGRARRIDPATAAFPAREARWNVTGLAVWSDPQHDDTEVAWARRIADSLLPWSFRGGGYLNYAAHDQPAGRVQMAFGADRWARLREVKRRYDPSNTLRYNANITP